MKFLNTSANSKKRPCEDLTTACPTSVKRFKEDLLQR